MEGIKFGIRPYSEKCDNDVLMYIYDHLAWYKRALNKIYTLELYRINFALQGLRFDDVPYELIDDCMNSYMHRNKCKEWVITNLSSKVVDVRTFDFVSYQGRMYPSFDMFRWNWGGFKVIFGYGL